MHEVKDLRTITERWRSRSRAARLMPENQGFLPSPPVEARRGKQGQVKLVHQQEGCELSPLNMYGRDLGAGPRCPVLYHCNLATSVLPQQRAEEHGPQYLRSRRLYTEQKLPT